MNFFERQDQARKKTGLLILYFVLAVFCILVCVNVVGIYAIRLYVSFRDTSPSIPIQSEWVFFISAGTITVVAFGSLFKIMSLSFGGGPLVAESLGGVKVPPNTSDLKERQLLNIVEEMSIASGCAVPTVYVLKKEHGLNAFAAGFKVNNAVIAITKGCLDTLNREELQGVIGHEFSHILNGDMTLNLRLMGVLHGILLIGLIGKKMMCGVINSSRPSKGGPIILLGFALYIIGYVGVFFGTLIKAAVSRQREFLADASAVQFTRNLIGIANALKKIGGMAFGSMIRSPNADEASHLFFGDPLTAPFINLMATHPPLQERIKRIDPYFNGKFPVVQIEPTSLSPYAMRLITGAPPRQKGFTVTTEHLVNQVGSLSPENLQYTFQRLSALPKPLSSAAHELLGASTIVYGLLLDSDPNIRFKQNEYLKKNAPEYLLSELQKLLPALDSLPAGNRMPLLELSLPTLKNLSHEQYLNFENNIDALIHIDGHVNCFELFLQKRISHNLTPHFKNTPKRAPQFLSFSGVKKHVECLLATLAHLGNPEDDKLAFAAFEKGAYTLRKQGETFTMPPLAECTTEALDDALKVLNSTPPFMRQKIMASSANCIMADRKVTLEEIETFRMVAACLDCPVPPILN